MTERKKVKFLDAHVKNVSVDEAEKEVIALFKAVRELGEDKIDVKIVFSALKELKPWDLV